MHTKLFFSRSFLAAGLTVLLVPRGECSMCLLTALTSSFLDCGASTALGLEVVIAHTVGDIDPEDSSNMRFLVAFEWTQGAEQSW